jgi:glycosyltransferase involved in cell wall biosynthesis
VSPHEAELARRLASRADVIHLLNSFPPPAAVPSPGSTAPVGPVRIVTVGRVAPQKDPDVFIRIVSMLGEACDVAATWVGDGPGEVRAQLEAAGVAVTGWLPVEQVPAAISGHTVYVHTAGWEAALPIAAIDAMNAGLPVVIRRNAAYRSMLPDAWQFDDAPAAVEMIRALARQPARQRRIREQFDLIAELRKDRPELILPAEYRRLARHSVPIPDVSPTTKESWWRDRYTAS